MNDECSQELNGMFVNCLICSLLSGFLFNLKSGPNIIVVWPQVLEFFFLRRVFFIFFSDFFFPAEYERMAEAYTVINQKLQNSVSEQSSLEKTIQELKVLNT